CVITIVDDGLVATRRGNRAAETKKLTAAEQECVDRVLALDVPQRVRRDGWTAQGWPVPDRPFRRILVRAVPDDVEWPRVVTPRRPRALGARWPPSSVSCPARPRRNSPGLPLQGPRPAGMMVCSGSGPRPRRVDQER